MRIKMETGLAVQILTCLAIHDEGCTRAALGKYLEVNSNRYFETLHALCNMGYVYVSPAEAQSSKCVYTLSKAADEITLYSVFEKYEGELLTNSICLFCRRKCRDERRNEHAKPKYCPYGKEMLALEAYMKKRLSRITIQDLANSQNNTVV